MDLFPFDGKSWTDTSIGRDCTNKIAWNVILQRGGYQGITEKHQDFLHRHDPKRVDVAQLMQEGVTWVDGLKGLPNGPALSSRGGRAVLAHWARRIRNGHFPVALRREGEVAVRGCAPLGSVSP